MGSDAAARLPLEDWIERQHALSLRELLGAVSATGLCRYRPELGRAVVPAPGSVLAAAVPAPGPDEPDYFFHWFRDAALVMQALLKVRDRLPAGRLGCLAEWVAFEAALGRRSGSELLTEAPPPEAVDPGIRRFLRPQAELAAVRGSRIKAEVRCNADGSLDRLQWGRPQHDGPALRALVLLDLLSADLPTSPRARQQTEALLLDDLRFCLACWSRPCFDPWEEEKGHHFFTRLALLSALGRGAAWARDTGRPRLATRFAAAAASLREALASHWSPALGYCRSRLPGQGISSHKALDASVLVAALRAAPDEAELGPLDPRIRATVARLEALFQTILPINAGRSVDEGLALGRFDGDRYFDGGAFLPCSFALAEHYYRVAAAGGEEADRSRARGDAVLDFLRRFVPGSGLLPEQLDRATGRPRSASNLAWSHAAFLTAVAARDASQCN